MSMSEQTIRTTQLKLNKLSLYVLGLLFARTTGDDSISKLVHEQCLIAMEPGFDSGRLSDTESFVVVEKIRLGK